MATFTMELREVLESLYGESMDEDDYEIERESLEFNGTKYGSLPVLSSYNSLGLGYYPIFNEEYRKILNGKIIESYWYREIGVETIEMFSLILRRKMNEIMPYFNQLYDSTLIAYSALDSMRIQSVGENILTGEESTQAVNSTETNTKGKARAVNSNFPQTTLAANGDYATSATDTNSENDVSADSIQNGESENKSKSNNNNLVTGYQGAASDLVIKFRNSLINIDTMVIAEIEDCFMMVFNNGDEHFIQPGY